MLIVHHKASFIYEKLVRCFRFVNIYACIAVILLVSLPFLGE